MPQPISQLAEYTSITASAFIPVVDVNELVASKNKKTTIAELRKLFFKAGTTLSSSFTRHTPGFYYFGDNSDGPGNFSGSITTLRTRISGTFASTQDGSPVIKNFSNLFVSRSVVISPTNRCRGMLIFVDGDATISGSISMTARGAKFTGSDASFTTINPPYLGDYWSTQLFPSASYLSRVFAVGAAGGAVALAANGNPGTAGTLGRSGGGGGGGSPTPSFGGGSGATGTSFSGGSGGGGAVPTAAGTNGRSFGGTGGVGAPTGGGGGAGNPSGTGGTPITATDGTGGLLILIVRGNLRIGPNGSISSFGSTGGGSPAAPGVGGGGSGGGIIYVYYGGTLTNNGTVAATGGQGGPSVVAGGGAGGAGTAIISRLNTAFPVGN